MVIVVVGDQTNGVEWMSMVAQQLTGFGEPEEGFGPPDIEMPGQSSAEVWGPGLPTVLGRVGTDDVVLRGDFFHYLHRHWLLNHPLVRVLVIERPIANRLAAAGLDRDAADIRRHRERLRSFDAVWNIDRPAVFRCSYRSVADDPVGIIEQVRTWLAGTGVASTGQCNHRRLPAVVPSNPEPIGRIGQLPVPPLRVMHAEVVATESSHASAETGRISVVIPVLDMVGHIAETIESVLTQPIHDLEVVVIDGGSTDGTAEVVARYGPDLAYWSSEPDNGHAHAINKGFAHTTGEIMCWLNGGDTFYPRALEVVNRLFTEYPSVEWIQGLGSAIDSSGAVVSPVRDHAIGSVLDFLQDDVPLRHIQQESTFWRRSLWDRAGAHLDESLELAVDFELWHRFFQHASLQCVRCLLGGFRIHEGQRSQSQRVAYDEEVALVNRQARQYWGLTAEQASALQNRELSFPLVSMSRDHGFGRKSSLGFAANPSRHRRETIGRLRQRIASLEAELERARRDEA